MELITDRPADMDTPDDGILEVRTAAEFAWLTRQANNMQDTTLH